MLLGKNIDEIDGDTIKSLIDGGASESVHLEFKRDTYGKDDKSKREFLKDISAFANTLGGHLIIGIDENDGVATSVKSISENVGKELDRLESMVLTGIEPTIAGLCMTRIDIDDKNIIIIYVPRSFNPPHRVIYKGINRYYGRKSAIVHQLSLEELRQAFGEQRSIEERAKSFIGQRFLSIQANDGIMPLSEENGALVMHLVPLSNFGAGHRIEATALHAQHQNLRLIHDLIGLSPRKINLEGCCIYDGGGGGAGYTQIFHNGVIEATTTRLFGPLGSHKFIFGSHQLPVCLIRATNNYMKGLRALEIAPPILLQISMMGVKGLNVGLDSLRFFRPPPYDRDVMHLPPSIISEFRDDKGYQSVIAEQMHFLWNAFDFARCDLFNENNEWDPSD